MPLIGPVQTFNPNQQVIRPIVPLIPPVPVDYLYVSRATIPNEDDETGITPFYPPQPPVICTQPAVFVQYAQGSADTDTDATFASNVTIGNLIVAGLITGLNSGPTGMLPATPPWTLLGGITVYAADLTQGSTNEVTIQMYGRYATSTNPIITRNPTSAKCWIQVWELADANLTPLAMVSKTHQAGSMGDTTMDLGPLIRGFNIMLLGYTRGTGQRPVNFQTVPGAGWNVELDHKGSTNDTNYGADNIPSYPDPLEAIATAVSLVPPPIQFVGQWCGIGASFGKPYDPLHPC